MFGNNPQRPAVLSDGLQLHVQEVFHTLQGEGPFSGSPAVFVRLAGCNLACSFCDTDFETSYSKDGAANVKELHDLVDAVWLCAQQHTRLLVLTGGEPLRQNVLPLIQMVLSDSRTQITHVQIETAGTLAPQEDDLFKNIVAAGDVTVVVSPKTPKVHPFFRQLKPEGVHWKYVQAAGDRFPEDGLPYKRTHTKQANIAITPAQQLARDQRIPAIARPPKEAALGGRVWVSPCDDHDPDLNTANVQAAVQTCLVHGYRLSLQTHKLVGLP